MKPTKDHPIRDYNADLVEHTWRDEQAKASSDIWRQRAFIVVICSVGFIIGMIYHWTH